MTATVTYKRLEIRSGPGKNFLVAGIGYDKSETVLDAGLTGVRAREEGRRLAQWFRVPLVDSTVARSERWPSADGRSQMAKVRA